MGWHAALMWFATLAGCLQSGAVICGDGRVCPASYSCIDSLMLCVSAEQLAACRDQSNDTVCSAGGLSGLCRDEVCVFTQCGDGIISGNEECDGANLNGKSSCSDEGIEFYYPGPIGCTDRCAYDVTMCTGKCGDGSVDEPYELCDGAWAGGTCLDYGFDAGRIECMMCGGNFDACGTIGWKPEASFTTSPISELWGVATDDLWASAGNELFRFQGDGWQQVTSPTASPIDAIWGAASNNVWLIAGSRAYRHDGTTWTASPPLTGSYRALWGAAADDVWAVGIYSGTGPRVARFNGTTWTETTVPTPTTGNLLAVSGTATDDVWAVGTGGRVVHFNGASWTVSPLVVNTDLHGVWARTRTDAWAVGTTGTAGTLIRYNGTNWVDFTALLPGSVPSLYAVWGTSPHDVWAAGASGVLLHFDGTHWTRIYSPTTATLRCGWSTDARDHLAAGGDTGVGAPPAVLLRSENSAWGSFQINANNDLPTKLNDVAFLRPNLGWAVGKTGNTGSVGGVIKFTGDSWNFHGAPTGELLAIWAASATAVWAVGNTGEIRYHDGAGGWTLEASPVITQLKDVWGSSVSDVWAVGGAGKILRRTAGSWQVAYTEPTGTTLDGIAGTGPDDIWAVGSAGTILHFDGTTWASIASPTSNALYGVVAFAANDAWIAGDNGTILRWDGAAWTIVAAPTSITFNDIGGSGPNDIFAIGASPTLIHWDGVTWTRVRTPPDAPYGLLSLFVDRRYAAIVGHVNTTAPYVARLERIVPWVCAATETACTDKTDDDCDGKIDALDSECP